MSEKSNEKIKTTQYIISSWQNFILKTQRKIFHFKNQYCKRHGYKLKKNIYRYRYKFYFIININKNY